MIRVTYKYSDFRHSEYTVEYETYKIIDDCIALYDLKSDGVECDLILLSKLINIRKQVKDLTKEEIYRYGKFRYGKNLSHIYITKHNIVYEIYGDAVYTETINNDTYFDITSLIKE